MQIRNLIYKGNTSKKFTFKRVDVLSPYRSISFHENQILQIDRDIPGKIAKIAKEEYPAFFEIETIDMSEEDYVVSVIENLIEKSNLEPEQFSKILSKFIVKTTRKKKD